MYSSSLDLPADLQRLPFSYGLAAQAVLIDQMGIAA
jgi:hypothetical protein